MKGSVAKGACYPKHVVDQVSHSVVFDASGTSPGRVPSLIRRDDPEALGSKQPDLVSKGVRCLRKAMEKDHELSV
jgi:hypothetical protein